MNRFFVILKRPLLALLLFLLFQAMGGVFVLLMQMLTGEGSLLENISDRIFDARLMGISTVFFNFAIAIACLILFRRSLYSQSNYAPCSVSWKKSMVAMLGCILGTIALDLLSELISLPNIVEDQMIDMCREPWGMLAIAIGAPIGEEIMFRWGIMGHMLRRNSSVPTAILVSAVLFGLMHMNPAQVFFAAAMGIMLGILYWRSGNILWPIILHVLNNSVACLQVWLLGDKVKEYSLVDTFGGNTMAWYAIGILSTLSISVLCYYALNGKREGENG
ncbi:MAG: CPBP family intramembrane metalloprotease [Bacteroidaceae bacterium]|nr:CPBP family intramembrane metalloprotease [Bacteroidaceae bacterium]